MNLIKYLIDYHDKGHMEQDRIWSRYDAINATGHCMKPTSVDNEQITWPGWHWMIHFQYALKIVFEDDTEMVFKGGPAAKEKVNDDGTDLVTFIEEYIANNYEIPHNNEVFISDDEEFIV